MKQGILAILLTCFIVGGLLLFGSPQTQSQTTYLRIHIRANSNSELDQNVKYIIKDEVVNFLTPLLVNGTTIERAKDIVQSNLKNIEERAKNTLNQNGFSYSAKANIKQEFFPTRTYDDLTLESGNYQALIIELGEGQGDNWWCVVYPPLCFVSNQGGGVIYKSKILEIIQDFKERYFN